MGFVDDGFSHVGGVDRDAQFANESFQFFHSIVTLDKAVNQDSRVSGRIDRLLNLLDCGVD